MRSPLLVTGVGRSGTTLVEKLIHSHPAMCVGSQPFPDLFIEAKRAFLAERGKTVSNPLGPRFPEAEGTLDELAEFLERDHWSASRLDDLFAALADNDGQYMKSIVSARGLVRPGNFFDVYDQLLTAVGADLGCEDVAWLGSKEVGFEELASILLDRGGAAVIVLRDPRDVLTSFHHGRGRDFVGAVRPTLFILRQWRKSVAFAIRLRVHRRFVACRYEDVVGRPDRLFSDVSDRLDVDLDGFGVSDGVVRDHDDQAWKGNSSFGVHSGLDDSSVGRWREHLGERTVRYVDAVCGPELAALGYPAEAMSQVSAASAISEFVEPIPVDHPRFRHDYSCDARAIETEQRRLELLVEDQPAGDRTAAALSRWFAFPEVFDALRRGGPVLGDGVDSR